jgi:hypothetical protein
MSNAWLQDSKITRAWHLKPTCSLTNFNKKRFRLDFQLINSKPQLLWSPLFGGKLGKVGIVQFLLKKFMISVLQVHGDIGNSLICKSIFLLLISLFEKLELGLASIVYIVEISSPDSGWKMTLVIVWSVNQNFYFYSHFLRSRGWNVHQYSI